LLKRLEVKYGRPADELIAYRADLDGQEARLQGDEEDLATIAGELAEAFAKLRSAAADLSKVRARGAKKRGSGTHEQLGELGLGEAKLDAVLETTPPGDDPATAEVPAQGADTLDLMLAANKGEPARPLRKVASGGEMARTMLALKTVLAAHDQVGTLV